MTSPSPTTSIDHPHGPLVFLHETWVLYRRAVLKLFRRPVILYFSLIQPMVWLLLFGQNFERIAQSPGMSDSFGGLSFLAFFAPAVMLQTILFGAGQSGLGLINDLDSGFLEKLLTTPINRMTILLGRVLGDMTRMMVQAVIILIAAFVGGIRFGADGIQMTITYYYGLPGILAALGIALLFGLVLAGFNVAVALTTRNTESTFLISNFLTLPLMFTSSALLPVELLPDWLQVISSINPVTYAINALRVLLYGPAIAPSGQHVVDTVLIAVGMLSVLAAITLTVGTTRFRYVVR
ncbi:MAG: ABC transporter permease [Chloroflexaceae bacterium]|nr:ABC transporter permease [Chloroflexaceae bacterium]